MRKVDKKHSESFKLQCDTSIVVDQRHIVGLNHGDRDHFLGHLNSVDRKLQKTYDKMDNIQNALDDNHAKVDELLDEHEGLLKELARIEKTIRDRVIRAKDL
ncbi:hypothetical protein NW762_012905 [Fusarium torreyae]|uniref:Uncharacterized protein n=1 Tax=Fusarium torreyae TaxID=1237075 RepID=A0A9W8RPN8_9HYPO|nr:hypothetical protein NW762_012905 [Fusarium torreyae]